ncbi:MAG: hypothetical protein ACRC8S_19170 [Fimbriiglobus sp.]
MTADEVRTILKSEPFVPFRIHVVGEVEYLIDRPDMVIVGQKMLFIGLRKKPETPFFDEPAFVALNYVTQLELSL